MTIGIFIIAAVATYLVTSLNPAIIFSKVIYHEDIREKGSGNAGFTNFKRVYGMKYGWLVFLIDISKAIIMELIFGWLFTKYVGENQRLLGIAFSGIFATLGHTLPLWYKFKGGKGFLVCISTLFLISWKAGLFTFVLLSIFLLLTKYMSLSTIVSMIAGTVVLPFMGVSIVPTILFAECALFMIYRHKENIKRLAAGTENKFSFGSKKKTEDKTGEEK